MTNNQSLFFLFSSITLLLPLLHCTTTLAQLSPVTSTTHPPHASPAAAPAALVPALPPTPASAPVTPSVDILNILSNARGFNVLIRLMKTTQLINQLSSQLMTMKSGGMTILAPDDSAFSGLKAGFLNSLSDGQKLELLQFHVLPSYVSSNNFDTLTNPVRTLAGANPTQFQLNMTGSGSAANISTGVVNTTITGNLYSDNHLVIYKLDKVLLPLDFFAAKTPAPAPAPAPALAPKRAAAKEPKAEAPIPEKKKPLPPSKSPNGTAPSQSQILPTVVASGTMRISMHGVWVSVGVALVAVSMI